ncbi:MAG: FAD/NAD(P)-binding protein [Phycisphaerae bacterium]|nr:FAD/NAD(P)-binding protein [Phycisphaerae bacterium]MDD5381939.1 FAD/NAD(P)-binding protein [Phycisphaerae bacterium]
MVKQSTIEKDIYLPRLAAVKQADLLNETELYLQLAMDGEQLDYVPGQFVEVSLAGVGEAPITISSSPTQKGYFELVVRKVGNVTNAIHKLKTGNKIGIRGPFGKGVYPVEESKGRGIVFICGGIGLVPQRSFINYVLDNRDDYGDVTILLGTKCQSQRFLTDELQSWSKRSDVQFLETVDQGDDCWKGNVGVVTTLIPKIESKLKSAVVTICGPPIMYKFVLMALQEYNLQHEDIYLNLERKMKCGVGKCGHCQINHVYACMDGPVFRYSDLAAMPEAI